MDPVCASRASRATARGQKLGPPTRRAKSEAPEGESARQTDRASKQAEEQLEMEGKTDDTRQRQPTTKRKKDRKSIRGHRANADAFRDFIEIAERTRRIWSNRVVDLLSARMA